MSFLHPLILGVGLGAVSIPIIIHFIRRRRRPIEWAAMRFLQDALRKRRRRLRIEQLLLLAARCLLVALLAFAIARPSDRAGVSGTPATHVLVIDNSIASAIQRDGLSDLERSVLAAQAFLRSPDARPGDRYAVVTTGSPARTLVWPPTPDADAARRALDRITPTDSRPAADAIGRALAPAPGDESPLPAVVHLFSAWRGVDTESFFPASGIRGVAAVRTHDVDSPAAELGNAGIASMTVTTPTVVGSSLLAPRTRVQGTIVRTGPLEAETINIELTAMPGGAIAGRAAVRFEPGQRDAGWSASVEDTALTPGRGGRSSILARLDDDANPRDNAAAVILARRRELRVGVVERLPVDGRVASGTWAMAALAPDERTGIAPFRVDPASLRSIPAGSVDALLILEPGRVPEAGWTRASELLSRGGLVIVAPDADATPLTWGAQIASMSDDALRINTSAGVRESASGLTRPAGAPTDGTLSALGGEFTELARAVGVTRHITLETTDNASVLVATEPGQPFLAQTTGRAGAGTLVVFASAIDVSWTDLPARPIFVPLMQELVRRGVGVGLDTAATAGGAFARSADAPGVDRWAYDATLSGTEGPADGSRAGVMVGLNADGAVVRTIAVRPDASAAGTEVASGIAQSVADAFPEAQIINNADADDAGQAQRASAWGDRLALLLLAACAVVAVFEALIARTASHPAGDRA